MKTTFSASVLTVLTMILWPAFTANAQILFQDQFTGSNSPAWTIVRPDPAYYSNAPTELVVRANSGDLYLGYNNCKNLFLIPTPTTGDFIATLKVRSFAPVATMHPQILLVAYDDDDNYVRCLYGSVDGTRLLELTKEIAGVYTGAGSHPIDFGSSPFWLQMRKQGSAYSQYYSTNGADFIRANGPTSFGSGTPLKLGFVVMADPPETSVAFIDSFLVEGRAADFEIHVSQVQVCFDTHSNTWVQVQYRSPLTANEWWPLTTNWVTGDGLRHCASDPVVIGEPQKYYRLATTNAPPP